MDQPNRRGMRIVPDPAHQDMHPGRKVLVVEACFCPNGHDLVQRRAVFSGHPGILLLVRGAGKEGLIALSPIYGDKTRIDLDVELVPGEIVQVFCPLCGVELPVFGPCPCGARMVAFFNGASPDFANCIGVCNRVGCKNAMIKQGGELIILSMIESVRGFPPEAGLNGPEDPERE